VSHKTVKKQQTGRQQIRSRTTA